MYMFCRIYKYPLFVNTERKFVNVLSKLQISKIFFFKVKNYKEFI